MKNLAKVLQFVAVLFFAGSLLVGGAAFLVTFLMAGQIGGELPMIYFEKLNLQTLSIALPAVGMIVFLMVLPNILSERKATEESNVVEFSAGKPTEEIRRSEQFSNHLKAA
jgi:hypothetical protein